MAYLTPDQLVAMGFRAVGRDVKVSERAAIHDADQIELGDHSRIDDFCVLSGRIRIGRNVHVAVFCNLAGGEQGIVLEDFAGLAYGCQVFTQNDDYGGHTLTNPTVPDRYKRETKAAVRIGRHVIVGTQSVILPGVTLAEGTSVGAMSLVTKSTQGWSVYFGVPARRLKARARELLALEAQYLADEAAVLPDTERPGA